MQSHNQRVTLEEMYYRDQKQISTSEKQLNALKFELVEAGYDPVKAVIEYCSESRSPLR